MCLEINEFMPRPEVPIPKAWFFSATMESFLENNNQSLLLQRTAGEIPWLGESSLAMEVLTTNGSTSTVEP